MRRCRAPIWVTWRTVVRNPSYKAEGWVLVFGLIRTSVVRCGSWGAQTLWPFLSLAVPPRSDPEEQLSILRGSERWWYRPSLERNGEGAATAPVFGQRPAINHHCGMGASEGMASHPRVINPEPDQKLSASLPAAAIIMGPEVSYLHLIHCILAHFPHPKGGREERGGGGGYSVWGGPSPHGGMGRG